MPGTFDGNRQFALALRTHIGLAARADFALLGDVTLQRLYIFIVDVAFAIAQEGAGVPVAAAIVAPIAPTRVPTPTPITIIAIVIIVVVIVVIIIIVVVICHDLNIQV